MVSRTLYDWWFCRCLELVLGAVCVWLLISFCDLAWDTFWIFFFLSGSLDRWPGYLGPSFWSPQALTLFQLSPEPLSCCHCWSSRTSRRFPAGFNAAFYTSTYFRHRGRWHTKLKLINKTVSKFLLSSCSLNVRFLTSKLPVLFYSYAVCFFLLANYCPYKAAQNNRMSHFSATLCHFSWPLIKIIITRLSFISMISEHACILHLGSQSNKVIVGKFVFTTSNAQVDSSRTKEIIPYKLYSALYLKFYLLCLKYHAYNIKYADEIL